MHRNLVFHSDEHFDTFISDIFFSTSKFGKKKFRVGGKKLGTVG